MPLTLIVLGVFLALAVYVAFIFLVCEFFYHLWGENGFIPALVVSVGTPILIAAIIIDLNK